MTLIHADDFWWFLRERHKIWRRRTLQKQPAPWTEDPVLDTHRFCNVFRELDRTTIWIKENLRDPLAHRPDAWVWICLARQLNNIKALEEVIEKTDVLGGACTWNLPTAKKVSRILEKRHARGDSCYSPAYMITGANVPHGWPKVKHTVLNVVHEAFRRGRPTLYREARGGASVEAFTRCLAVYPGWGMFLAYEVACDLAHMHTWLTAANDLHTWANPGPGAMRGLNRLQNRPLEGRLPEATYIDEMRELFDWFDLEFPAEWLVELWEGYSIVPDMRAVEHTLCEYDKWKRGGGKQRYRHTRS